MSPSNNRGFFADKTTPETMAGLVVPFPNLNESDDKSPSQSHRRLSNPTQHDHKRAVSDPISLPESHIRRTPSELQFEQSLIQAEYSDVIMYARLVRGMTERGAGLHSNQVDSTDRQGHALSRKSLMGVVECRQRPILEEGHFEDDNEEECDETPLAPVAKMAGGFIDPNINSANLANAESGWSIGYCYDETPQASNTQGALCGVNNSAQETPHLPLYSRPMTMTSSNEPPEHGHYREVSATTYQDETQQDEEEDECVFSLEL